MTNSEMLSKLGYAYIRNVLTIEQCEKFADLLLDLKQSEKLSYEGAVENPYYKESYGGNHPDFEKALREVQPRIEEELQVKMKPANSFGRLYYNGGTLPPHIDRKELDFTLSITLRSTLDKDWPLWCTDKVGNDVPLYIAQGDGGMMYGNAMKHWRDNLICEPGQYSANLFMHWSFA